RLVLRALEKVEFLPTGLCPPERLPIEFDVESLGGEIAFFHRNEVVEPHAFGGNLHAPCSRHGESPGGSPVPLASGRFRGPCSAIRNMYHIPIQESVNHERLEITNRRRGGRAGRGRRAQRRSVRWNCCDNSKGAGGGWRRARAETPGGGDRNAARQSSPLPVQSAQCRADHPGSGNRP